ncbi:aldo/keto reductase [uncultured Vagococcus sp.]|uniref:aldo/keto reductase n=1 Tax=uncultured Vagococcus sp. TaxID=189676 RepID=UPI0028D62CB0|nr:aldo/keto reductase [uncultured Vagococcus sp.]
MKKIVIKGQKEKHEIEIECTAIFMGSSDFLRLDNKEEAWHILDNYLALGGTSFDTARHYRHSERALGAWMEERQNRDHLIIETKCCHPIRGTNEAPRVNSGAIEEDLLTSLEYLKTDHVELLALHRDDPTQPVGDIMEGLHKQVSLGRVYGVGLSNWELPRIKEAMAYAEAHHLTTISFNSPNLSLASVKQPRWPNCVTANAEMKAWHETLKLPLIAWSSQAEGFFAGRFDRHNLDNQEIVDVYYSSENWEKYDRVQLLAQQKGVLPIQISLAYVLNQPFPTGAVIGSETLSELKTSIAGAEINLTAAEMAYLNLQAD